jgi:hypothetical protein
MAETTTTPEFGSLQLEQLVARSVQRLPRDVAYRVEADMFRDVFDQMVFEVSAYVWAEKLLEQTMVVPFSGASWFDFPSSPWQHFKDRHRAKWWMRWYVHRWPVFVETHRKEYTHRKTVVLEQFAKFPACDIRMPEKYGPAVRFERARLRDA